MPNKTIYTGMTKEAMASDEAAWFERTYHYTDDFDNLPPDIVDYNAIFVTNFSHTDLMRTALKVEEKGDRIRVELKGFFYETPRED